MEKDPHANNNDPAAVPESAIQENPEIKALEKLQRKVESTRLNRIHASNRLLKRERFVQTLNIYYSCVSAIITVLGLLYPERSFGIASAILTIILAISIVHLNAQKYGSRAQQMQMNYLALQQLAFDIGNSIAKQQTDTISELQRRYVDLLQTSENHEDQDYWLTLYKANRRNKPEISGPQLRGFEEFRFWLNICSAFAFQAFLWLLPIAYGAAVLIFKI